MASHIAHLLFAEESARAAGIGGDRGKPLFVLGAQGPDLFLHSQRRKPRGIQYGGLLHRKGFPRLLGELTAGSEEANLYARGLATHIILDRWSHPFINYFAGWWDRRRPETKKYRHMHPFLERLVDIEILRRKEGASTGDLDFGTLVDCGEELPKPFFKEFSEAMRKATDSARRDEQLEARISNAYADAPGYYQFTSVVDEAYMEEATRREAAGEITDRWLSLIHPPRLPYTLDVLNLEGRRWFHPCVPEEPRNESFLDLWERGLSDAVPLLQLVAQGEAEAVVDGVGEENLNDGIKGATPCPRREMGPLPLRELYDAIRSA